jgi:hypothetical protein
MIAPEHECVRDLGTNVCAVCLRVLPMSHPTFLTHPSRRGAREVAIAAAFPSPRLQPQGAMLEILDAVSGGAIFVLSGPNHDTGADYGATLESSSGARCVDAHGPTLAGVLEAIARQWSRL